VSVARANWHASLDLPTDGPDPFEAPVEEVGEEIRLASPTAALHLRLRELVNREARLDGIGVTCALKGTPGVVCSACPISRAGTEDRLSALCSIGREQERVCTEIAVKERYAVR
jgi:hypothetical protein